LCSLCKLTLLPSPTASKLTLFEYCIQLLKIIGD
jgi:hypothetical protein